MNKNHTVAGRTKSSTGTLARGISLRSAGRFAASLLVASVATSFISGCDVKSFIDPSEVGRYSHKALLLPILDRLDTGVEEPNDQFAKSEDVRPEDLVAVEADYVLGKNDLVTITINDLNGVGTETTRQVRVSESGLISLPLIKQIQAEGLSEAQLETSIAAAYADAKLLPNAQVTVSLAAARARTFSLLGAVAQPGEYEIPRTDFRVLDALVTAREFGVSGQQYIYVVRKARDAQPEVAPAAPINSEKPGGVNPDIFAPQSSLGGQSQLTADAVAGSKAQWRVDALQPRMLQTADPAAPAVGSDNEGRYVTIDGKTVPVGQSPTTKDSLTITAPPPPPLDPTTLPAAQLQDFNFEIPEATGERIIRVPLQALRNGDLKQNIVVRPGDLLILPPAQSGVIYMGGHVQRTGVYSLPFDGTKMTLKQAIISAGMLDGLAIPQRTDVIRRIGTDREVFARVNLDAIFAGRQPDIFLKPNDTVMVGTNFFAPFLAAIRGGFRFTYGFGFLYDRNYYLTPNEENGIN